MLLEDPYVGLAILGGLVACVAAIGWGLRAFRRLRNPPKVPEMAVVIGALSDLEDAELENIGQRLRHLPEAAARDVASELADYLVEWRTTFDVRARQAFLDLANGAVAAYDRQGRPQGSV